MFHYIFIYLIALLNCFNKNKSISKVLSLAIMCYLCLMSAFRNYSCGIDTPNYLNIYRLSRAEDFYENEFIFDFFIKLFDFWGLEPTTCQVIMSLFCFIPLTIYFFKKSPYIQLTILLFLISPNNYFLETFNIVRQLCALPFFLWAVSFYYDNKYVKSIIFFILAVGFHNSTLIFIPIVIIAKIINVKYYLGIIVIILTAIWSLFIAGTGFLTDFYAFISNLQVMGLSKYSYLETTIGDYSFSMIGVLVLMLPGSFLSLYALKYYPKNDYVKLYFLGCVFLNFVAFMPLSYRMTYNLIAIELILIPSLLKKYSNFIKINSIKKVNYKYLYLFILFYVLLCVRQFINDSFQEQYVPYETFF